MNNTKKKLTTATLVAGILLGSGGVSAAQEVEPAENTDTVEVIESTEGEVVEPTEDDIEPSGGEEGQTSERSERRQELREQRQAIFEEAGLELPELPFTKEEIRAIDDREERVTAITENREVRQAWIEENANALAEIKAENPELFDRKNRGNRKGNRN